MAIATHDATTPSTRVRPARAGRRHPGPPTVLPPVLVLGLLLAAALVGPVVAGHGLLPGAGGHGVSPADLADGRSSSQVAGLLLVQASLALVLLGGLLEARLTFLAPNAPGPQIAASGALVAAAVTGLAGAAQWVLSRGDVLADPGLTRALTDVAWVLGGPVSATVLGPVVLGTAVTALFVRRTPTALTWAGFATAGLCLVSGAALLAPSLAPLAVVARAAAVVWLVVLCAVLPRNRAPRGTARTGHAVGAD